MSDRQDLVRAPAQAPNDRPESGSSPAHRVWEPPQLEELPRLTELTLQSGTGDPIDGGSGSTVF